ncbi:F-box/WD-40 repeat-containing protein At3g52030-like [Durio zibethinus]|uniref:F-box/WD-40 repeat-containing protein At3g52030-like n=1 Tax=Durio zibethinus TaxID=66656 RepID=A0A6P6AXJ3_DURZI|nr:F-box/WD-40 repeat-containing protein At3g52030-like [Durio zibethinus]
MRLWSLDGYNCVEEYHIPDTFSLVDFDFDKSKIVGLLGSRVGIWRCNGKRSIFPYREGTFSKGALIRILSLDVRLELLMYLTCIVGHVLELLSMHCAC